MTTAPVLDDDILNLVAEEISAAQIADIPPRDLPQYVADRLRLRVEGCYQYIRKRGLSPAHRAAEIRRKFNGSNGEALALEYKLTLRRVQQLVNGK